MRRTPIWLLPFLVWVLCPATAFAKPRPVQLPDELERAKVVTPARILRYDAEQLVFQPLPEPSQEMTARYLLSDPGWDPTRFIRDDWSEDSDPIYTAAWPAVKAEVLIVVSADDQISLFAWRRGDEYRFWSPWMTGSMARFSCSPPARVLPGNEIKTGSDVTPASWDGCLLPISAVVTKGVRTAHSMKGWELYSWQKDGTWYFALMPGTNRIKSDEEIRAAGVQGMAVIQASLGDLDRGDQVFWFGPVPPIEVVREIHSRCEELGLQLVLH